MCGLAGFLGGNLGRDERHHVVKAMATCVAHRGPDDSGEWLDDSVALGFRRLSIIDLSPAGNQPMLSASGRFAIVYNGEVYNYEAIRAELIRDGKAPEFRGHSDTEVMLAAFEAWGVEAAVKRFIGMFAIALWDRELRILSLVRDRMGVKPLYYARRKNSILFSSELKPMHAHPDFTADIDRDALALYFHYGYIPAPHTIFRDVRKVYPGTIVTISGNGESSEKTYWSAAEAAERGLANRFRGTQEEAAEALDVLLRDSVALRMISDVPLGVFLSGGIDSSIIAALMQAQSSVPVKTFAIGFREDSYDEAPFAAKVARHLGTEHTELYLSAEDAMAVIPKLPSMFDEPFADSSQIPTYFVSELARRHVTVTLSGDGGDELFGGYHRYFLGQRARRYYSWLPKPLRLVAGTAAAAIPKSVWNATAGLLLVRAGERVHMLANGMKAGDDDAMYFELLVQWRDVVLGGTEPAFPLTDRTRWARLRDPIERMMYFDQVSFLPDDILTKVDRASMAVSLEAREPLLDHRLVELAWTFPLSMKVRGGQGKWLLRQLLERYVPKELFERPKKGFGIPVGDWLRGPLRDWAEDLLDERRLRDEGYLDAGRIHAAWKAHLAGTGNWQYHMWTTLMFVAWLRELR